MKKRPLSALMALVLSSTVSFAAAPQPDLYKQSLGIYSLSHSDLKDSTQATFVKSFVSDYQPLFQKHSKVDLQQYLAFENARLQSIIEKRREMSLKQAHVRFGVINQDKDDKITLKEFQETGFKTFNGFDKNQDGIINAEDQKLAPVAQGTHDGLRITTPLAMPMANSIAEFIQMYGGDKGFVTLGDYLKERDQQYFHTDANHDLTLSEQEYVTEFMQRYDENLQKAKAEYQTIFTEQFKSIANNKATISSKDVDAYAKLLFKHFDANKNGRLEANEL
ncbi:hypothetical protein GCM10023206_16410 [Acinetobacter puyangensis]|uniref:EF-hand domain-containing protein n=1 Tax=Acinetobacter puyangensis TaxID=1096779 RepID=A0A240E6A6_9GAMM|nr:hypothetical protein [Acinetobacter puyangensis]SNX44096.1 hypothetical protein SAMN05421731_102255 [Acinetobacter puyangensis]